MSAATRDPALDPWLAQFPSTSQHYLTAWFAYAAAQRPQTPEGVLEIVQRLARRKLDWATSASTETLCRSVLLALVHHKSGALDYASALLAHEAHEERGRDILADGRGARRGPSG